MGASVAVADPSWQGGDSVGRGGAAGGGRMRKPDIWNLRSASPTPVMSDRAGQQGSRNCPGAPSGALAAESSHLLAPHQVTDESAGIDFYDLADPDELYDVQPAFAALVFRYEGLRLAKLPCDFLLFQLCLFSRYPKPLGYVQVFLRECRFHWYLLLRDWGVFIIRFRDYPKNE